MTIFPVQELVRKVETTSISVRNKDVKRLQRIKVDTNLPIWKIIKLMLDDTKYKE